MNWQKFFTLFKKPVIESSCTDPALICWQAELYPSKINPTTLLTVQADQLALILFDQVIQAIVEHGTCALHTVLNASNIKQLSALQVYFFSTKIFSEQRWGTASPIVVQSTALGVVTLRAHGTFSYSVANPKVLWRHVPINIHGYNVDEMIGQLRSLILSQFASTLALQAKSILTIYSQRTDFAKEIKQQLQSRFKEYGLYLQDFLVQSISLPENQTDKMESFVKLERLNELYQQGILTAEEFQMKKKALLGNI